METGKIMSILEEKYKEKAVVSSKDPFKVLISTVLSQRTKDANTAKSSKQLFEKASTPKEILKLGTRKIDTLYQKEKRWQFGPKGYTSDSAPTWHPDAQI